MSTQVYYRKWRPRRFDQVVGQQPVTQTLRQAISRDRVGHAYLFCGPRGTGKTSTARILAKAVTCLEQTPGHGEPCEQCALCIAVDNGSMMDLIEIDAASNRGIDEIRSLREKVQFAPSEARYKVYIIDEAHMLTKEAVNAFLKTLEEPPPHTIFILATTEPQKLLPTIISRCQRFDFRRIALPDIVERLAQVCRDEAVEADAEAIRVVARSAWGSLRDAENLLEQLVTSYGTRIGMEEVRGLLGLSGDDRTLALVKHLLAGHTTQALQVVNAVASEGLDLRQLLRQVVDYLRAVMLIKSGARDNLDHPKDTVQELSFLASGLSLNHLLKIVKLFGSISFRYDNPSSLPLELAVVEATLEQDEAVPARGKAHVAISAPIPEGPAPTPSAGPPHAGEEHPQEASPKLLLPSRADRGSTGPTATPSLPVDTQSGVTASSEPASSSDMASLTAADGGLEHLLDSQWPAILKELGRYKGQRFFLGALLRDCNRRQVADGTVVLWFAHRSHMERVQVELEDPRCRRDVGEVFHRVLGTPCDIRLSCEGHGPGSQQGGPRGHLVRAALGMGGKIIQEENDTQKEPDDVQ